MSTNLPAIRDQQALALPNLQDMLKNAEILIKSKLLPESIKTPEQAVVIMLKGRELGLPPMVALEHIYTVKQKAGLDGQVIQGLLRRDGHSYVIDEETPIVCRMRFWRRGENHDGYQVEVTMKEAQEAGWDMEPDYDEQGHKKGMKKKYTWAHMPATMLMWRTLAKGARRYCGDSLTGTVTANETNIDPDDALVDGEIVRDEVVRRDQSPLKAGGTGNRSQVFKSERKAPSPPEEPVDAQFTEPEPEQSLAEAVAAEIGAEVKAKPVQPTLGEMPPQELHWIDDEKVKARFWAYAGSLGLDENAVHEALKGRVHAYKGSMTDAKKALEEYATALVEKHRAAKAAQPELLGVGK